MVREMTFWRKNKTMDNKQGTKKNRGRIEKRIFDVSPLFKIKDEQIINEENLDENLLIMPLRNNVLLPGVLIPITIGRQKTKLLLEKAEKENLFVGVLAQKDAFVENPEFADLFEVGTVAKIVSLFELPDGTSSALIQGRSRFQVIHPNATEPFMEAKVKKLPELASKITQAEIDNKFNHCKKLVEDMILHHPEIPQEVGLIFKNFESQRFLLNFWASNSNADVLSKQQILEAEELDVRLNLLIQQVHLEEQFVELKRELHDKVRTDMDQQQREYFLQQQMKTIQDELGDSPNGNDVKNLETRGEAKKWNEETKTQFNKELAKLKRMNIQSADYNVQYNYLDTFVDLPWNELSEDNLDVNRAAKILDNDHFGLEKVKERILEHLSVLKLKGDMKAPILCFYGPPGVGKTSLGKSIAEALGRKYVRMSLGGVHDESEIRGHRKTYIGAMPGRIIQHLKKAGAANPVFVLDEIDKLGKSNHGDPSSALLEVLDPEQNTTFYDNYVESNFDLSKVMFIATANSLANIQGPLRDRMEIIEVNGYTIEEKIEIAKNHLLTKQINSHGLKKAQISVGKATIEKIIEEHTNESGVRTLDKQLAKVVRSRAKQIAMEESFEVKIEKTDLKRILGPGRDKTKYDNNAVPGVVTGLAWTSVGGDILFIESSLSKGNGKLTLTGNLGDVMKESAVIALEYLKSNCSHLNIEQEKIDTSNVHIHFTEGATPKDGPSAGITMLTSLASSFTGRKVKSHLAMTGEITLRGEVLPVGGIKEKILAAKRATIKEIILCERNQKDIEEIPAHYLKGLKFHYVKQMKEVLELALEKK